MRDEVMQVGACTTDACSQVGLQHAEWSIYGGVAWRVATARKARRVGALPYDLLKDYFKLIADRQQGDGVSNSAYTVQWHHWHALPVCPESEVFRSRDWRSARAPMDRRRQRKDEKCQRQTESVRLGRFKQLLWRWDHEKRGSCCSFRPTIMSMK